MIEISGPVVGAAIAFGGVVFGLLVNGDRAERQRRRDLHARALAAILAYGEMPFMIRRRRCEEAYASEERVRLSDHFSEVKAEIVMCQALLSADGDERLSAAYSELVETARATAGAESHEAWKEPPVSTDGEMNMAPLHERLAPFRKRITRFELDLARATLPRRKRLWRWLKVRTSRKSDRPAAKKAAAHRAGAGPTLSPSSQVVSARDRRRGSPSRSTAAAADEPRPASSASPIVRGRSASSPASCRSAAPPSRKAPQGA